MPSFSTDNISPLLGSLISLIRLSLGHNKLSGSLPDSLGNLIHLQYFSAEHNRLSGSIPSFMCHMTALEVFHVSHNDLSGPIPDKIGSLARLKKLDLSSNRLSGELPPGLGSLSALNWLRLDNNVLTGTVPASLGNLTELLILNLSSNRLSGALPAALGTLINLTTASLRGNSFHGPFQLPSSFQFWFSRTSGMRTLDLGSNELEEPFPDLKGIRQLRSLVLDNNRIYGGLEEQGLAEACPNLHKLHLQNNRLTGEVSNETSRTYVVVPSVVDVTRRRAFHRTEPRPAGKASKSLRKRRQSWNMVRENRRQVDDGGGRVLVEKEERISIHNQK